MKILWVSNLIGDGTFRDPIRPKIENIRNSSAKSFPCSWFITTKPVPFAIGIADVDVVQLATIQGDTDIIAFNLTDLKIEINKLASVQKTWLASLGSKLAITTQPNQSLDGVLENMLGTFCLSKIKDISGQMFKNFGV